MRRIRHARLLLVDFGPADTSTTDALNVSSNTSLLVTYGDGTLGNLSTAGFDSSKVTSGTTNPDPTLGIPPSATRDAMIADRTSPGPHVVLSGLDRSSRYRVDIFASGGNNRQSGFVEYRVAGASVISTSLDTKLNRDKIASVELRPSSAGSISITIVVNPEAPLQHFTVGALTLERVGL